MNNSIELLAPAGNKDSFLAAAEAGCDAVYLGLKDFSARSKAKNFSYPQLYRLCDYARKKKIKIFVAVNTLIKQAEISDALRSLEYISSAEADAIIIQDFAFLNLALKYFPQLRLHASTQLAVHNSFGAKQAAAAGFSRVVLSRELSFEQIKSIKQNSNIELEIFCHGALCFSVSGLCLFSSYIGGYSGNRGKCTQPCRRLWNIDNKEGFFLSPKDLELSSYIQQLKEIGIRSVKIEGRMKSPDYVYKTVKAYRLLIDSDKDAFPEALKQAREILSFDYARKKTDFNFISKNNNIFEPEKTKNTGLYLGVIEDKNNKEFSVKTVYNVEKGDTLRIVDKKRDRNSVFIVRDIQYKGGIFTAGYEKLYIEKGFEVYKTADKYEKIYEDIFINLPELPKVKSVDIHSPVFKHNVKLPQLFLRFEDFKWIPLLKASAAALIVKLTKNNIQNIKTLPPINNLYIELPSYIDEQDLPRYSRNIDCLIKTGCGNFFINNISHFYFFKNKKINIYAGQFLYSLNSYSAEFLSKSGVAAFTVPWEDDLTNMTSVSKFLKGKIIVYLSGFPEIAVSKMLVPDKIKNKNIKSNRDEFKIIDCGGDSVLIPKFPVSFFNLKNNFLKLKINSFAVDLSYISPNKNYLSQILKAFNGQAYISSDFKFNIERQLK
ncbi:MAG: peptidase U32 family protein [Endomicrobiaceae bacterium]